MDLNSNPNAHFIMYDWMELSIPQDKMVRHMLLLRQLFSEQHMRLEQEQLEADTYKNVAREKEILVQTLLNEANIALLSLGKKKDEQFKSERDKMEKFLSKQRHILAAALKQDFEQKKQEEVDSIKIELESERRVMMSECKRQTCSV